MQIENPDNLPLADRLTKAELLARELCDHLQVGLLPKLGSLRASSKILDQNEVSDQTIFDQTSEVLKAQKFAKNLHESLMKYLESIQRDAHQVLGIDSSLTVYKEKRMSVEIQDIAIEEEL
jgi:hypothetical protein